MFRILFAASCLIVHGYWRETCLSDMIHLMFQLITITMTVMLGKVPDLHCSPPWQIWQTGMEYDFLWHPRTIIWWSLAGQPTHFLIHFCQVFIKQAEEDRGGVTFFKFYNIEFFFSSRFTRKFKTKQKSLNFIEALKDKLPKFGKVFTSLWKSDS